MRLDTLLFQRSFGWLFVFGLSFPVDAKAHSKCQEGFVFRLLGKAVFQLTASVGIKV
jgi:hypothetical protein